ncbi:MAG: hypothetical protein WC795_00065 [Candidatus Paceibacterota bacterium]|jgi:hypothetical protein
MKNIILSLFFFATAVLVGEYYFHSSIFDKNRNIPPVQRKKVPISSNSSNISVLNKIYRQYKNGIISECPTQGEMFYTAGLNVYDGTTDIFDSNGIRIVRFGGLFPNTEGNANIDLENCKNIYVVQKNIWGLPPVDKYYLQDQ